MSLRPFNPRTIRATAHGLAIIVLVALLGAVAPRATIAHGGEDHGDTPATPSTTGPNTGISIVTAERSVQGESGSFTLLLKRSPGDVRTGETEQFVVRIAEKVEGGFGGGGPVLVEGASVLARITAADGRVVANDLAVKSEANANYRTSYTFGSAGDYKIAFIVTTSDGRTFTTDFPVTVVSGPVRTSFWVLFAFLLLLFAGAVGMIVVVSRRRSGGTIDLRRTAPLLGASLVIFLIGFIALYLLLPPREIRAAVELPGIGESETAVNTLATNQTITVPKESQLLFGIKTIPVGTRAITSGLKTTGIVRPRPDAQAVVVPPVAGVVVLRQGITLGSAVGRGEAIGYVEQVLDVSGQATLESQRLEVAAQQREVEAKRLEIRNTVLQLQGQQAEQRAKAQQARTQLAQAQREHRRAQNLVEVGAAPRKRLEEAATAVSVAEQEVTAAEKQVAVLDTQIRQTQAGQAIFTSPRVNVPTKRFPLTAPTTGLVNEVKVTSGQQVDVGTQLLSIVNLSTVLIEAQVFERDIDAVRGSTRASFTNAALGGEVYTIGTRDGDGRLVSIGQTVNEQSRTFPVLYEMKNPGGLLKDGMFVDITIDTSGDRQVLAVPKAAVVNDQGQTYVFVFKGGETFEKRLVALGAEGNDFYEVKSGLKENERVVIEGVYQLRTTQPSA